MSIDVIVCARCAHWSFRRSSGSIPALAIQHQKLRIDVMQAFREKKKDKEDENEDEIQTPHPSLVPRPPPPASKVSSIAWLRRLNGCVPDKNES